jgi:hypothetical protein
MMFRRRGPQPKFGERFSLSVRAEPRAGWSGRGVFFTIADADPGEPVDVQVIDHHRSVVAQGTIHADANGDVEYLMPWPYPSGEYRVVTSGRRSGKTGNQTFRM